MDMAQAVVLGLVQGLGEFLPISSSAHLVLAPWFMKWADPGLTFDIALHVGTLIAVVLYFWKDWFKLLSKGLTRPKEREGKLFWYLVLATIPGALIGFMLENIAETLFRHPVLIACMLVLLGMILYGVDRKGKKQIERGAYLAQDQFSDWSFTGASHYSRCVAFRHHHDHSAGAGHDPRRRGAFFFFAVRADYSGRGAG